MSELSEETVRKGEFIKVEPRVYLPRRWWQDRNILRALDWEVEAERA